MASSIVGVLSLFTGTILLLIGVVAFAEFLRIKPRTLDDNVRKTDKMFWACMFFLMSVMFLSAGVFFVKTSEQQCYNDIEYCDEQILR